MSLRHLSLSFAPGDRFALAALRVESRIRLIACVCLFVLRAADLRIVARDHAGLDGMPRPIASTRTLITIIGTLTSIIGTVISIIGTVISIIGTVISIIGTHSIASACTHAHAVPWRLLLVCAGEGGFREGGPRQVRAGESVCRMPRRRMRRCTAARHAAGCVRVRVGGHVMQPVACGMLRGMADDMTDVARVGRCFRCTTASRSTAATCRRHSLLASYGSRAARAPA